MELCDGLGKLVGDTRHESRLLIASLMTELCIYARSQFINDPDGYGRFATPSLY